jgi:hypothetical protein
VTTKKKRGRISPTEALRLLRRRGVEPMQAAVALTNAIHASVAFQVWCEGNVVSLHMRPDIRVVARKDGRRWVAEVESISHQWPGAHYRWEFDANKVQALRKAETHPAASEAELTEPRRRRPGPKYKDDWPIVMASEIIRLALSDRDREMLKNVAALGRYMKEFLLKEHGSAPQDPGAIEEMLRVLLQRVR